MWRLVVLLCLGAAVALDREYAKEAVTAYRIRGQNLHIDQLEKDVEQLEAQFDKLSDDVEKSQIDRIKARLRTLEGNFCGKREVSCGGAIPECVHNLFVCDGHKDCTNGRDEDADVCSLDVVAVGSSFQGTYHWKSCVQREDHIGVITIIANRRSSFFGPRAWVRATITSVAGDQLKPTWTSYSYTAHGYFVFASRQLILIPDASAPHKLGTICTFGFGDNNTADCRVVSQASLYECAYSRLTRV